MMDIFGMIKERLLGPNVKVLALPVGLIVILFILFIYTLKTGYSQISSRLTTLKESEKQKQILEEKLEILSEIKEGILAQSDTSIIAVPDRNPALWVLSQLKSTAFETSLTLLNTRVRNEGHVDETLKKMNLEFSLEGEILSIISLIKSVEKFAPVTTVESVSIENTQEGLVAASVGTIIFWGELPTKIPPITEPIKRLSAKENELFALIDKLRRPTFTVLTPIDPLGTSSRENPFN